MTVEAASPTGPSSAAPARAGEASLQRILKISIVAMGILIVVGLLTVIGRIIYMASHKGQQTSSVAAMAPGVRLALPDGAQVRSMSLSGDRLAVHFDAPGGGGIAIVDLASGQAVSRIELVPEPPRR